MLGLLRAIVITQGQLPGCSSEVWKHLDDSGGPMHTKIRKGLKTFLKNYYSRTGDHVVDSVHDKYNQVYCELSFSFH